jgi:hypothetical protein
MGESQSIKIKLSRHWKCHLETTLTFRVFGNEHQIPLVSANQACCCIPVIDREFSRLNCIENQTKKKRTRGRIRSFADSQLQSDCHLTQTANGVSPLPKNKMT